MKNALLKIIAVALAYFITHVASLSFNSEYYYAITSMALCSISLISISFSFIIRSKLLVVYATIYTIAAIMYALLYIPAIALQVDYYFYESIVNFSMIINIADFAIIAAEGIDAIYRIYNMRVGNRSNDSFFDACMGLRQWQR